MTKLTRKSSITLARVLALALSASFNAPIPETKFGVLRM